MTGQHSSNADNEPHHNSKVYVCWSP